MMFPQYCEWYVVVLLQVFSAQTEADSAELGASPQLAAALLLQRKCHRGFDLWLQRRHYASATRFVCMK